MRTLHADFSGNDNKLKVFKIRRTYLQDIELQSISFPFIWI